MHQAARRETVAPAVLRFPPRQHPENISKAAKIRVQFYENNSNEQAIDTRVCSNKE
jgi:hypothetical protein